VRITGTMRFRENMAGARSARAPTGINGNPLTTDQSAETPVYERPTVRVQAQFDGAVVNQTEPITVATGLRLSRTTCTSSPPS